MKSGSQGSLFMPTSQIIFCATWCSSIRFFRAGNSATLHCDGFQRNCGLIVIHNVQPLCAALDKGPQSEGLLFRIARQNLDEETEILWRREKVGPGYIPTFVEAFVDGRSATALAFVADHDADVIDANLTRADQVHYFATGSGFLGSSLEYLTNINRQFAALGIYDEDVSALLRETEAYMNLRQTGL